MAEAAADGGVEWFSYNREVYNFNRTMRQKNLYQHQKQRVMAVVLYREDLRDLFGLTIGKMDCYMLVSTLLVGFCTEMFYKGRTPLLAPNWLFWPWSITLGAAFFYFFLSIWLALHASISAQTYSVRSLTQWLRLPVASAMEISEGSARLEDFEGSGVGGWFRVPVVTEYARESNLKIPGLKHKGAKSKNEIKDLTTEWDTFKQHFALFNQLHRKWQGHEAYARVCMCMGTLQILYALGYFALLYWGYFWGNPLAAYVIVTLCSVAALLNAKMNLTLSFIEFCIMAFLTAVPPFLYCAAVLCEYVWGNSFDVQLPQVNERPALIFALAAHIMSLFYELFFVYLTVADKNGLPVKFSTVWCIDVLGFGLETIKEVSEPVAEPKIVNSSGLPGFTDEGPINDWGVHKPTGQQDEAKAGEYHPDISKDLKYACSKAEKDMQKIFKHWAKEEHLLSDSERKELTKLKVRFEKDRKKLAQLLGEERGKGDATPGTPFNPTEGWIRLGYKTDGGENLPYYLNVETGEIKWDAPTKDAGIYDYKETTKSVESQLKQFELKSKALLDQERAAIQAATDASHREKVRIPYLLFRFGSAVIVAAWLFAIAETSAEVSLKYDPSFNERNIHHRRLAAVDTNGESSGPIDVTYMAQDELRLPEHLVWYTPRKMACGSSKSRTVLADFHSLREVYPSVPAVSSSPLKCAAATEYAKDKEIKDVVVKGEEVYVLLDDDQLYSCKSGESILRNSGLPVEATSIAAITVKGDGEFAIVSSEDGKLYVGSPSTGKWRSVRRPISGDYKACVSIQETPAGDLVLILSEQRLMHVFNSHGLFIGAQPIPAGYISGCGDQLLAYSDKSARLSVARGLQITQSSSCDIQ
ncbi:pumilio domain member 4 [Perkinsus olseni]|uniref:Pumilio domain member 4 n=1 Tax=Perkinsus olseni TaxID=32597 RepID=A0A7J6MUF5_PEROL|nr:pumilio domain member 4 [Perkinsus olseni]